MLLRFANETDEEALRRAAALLRPRTQDRGVAFLIENRVDAAAAVGADGVHLASPQDYGPARHRLGAERIVGVTCRTRHDAMVTAEAGADYVAFGGFDAERQADETRDLVEWWSRLMTVPCVAASDASPARCRDWIATGADFVAVGGALWQHPDGPGAAFAALARAIAEPPSG